MTQHVIHISSNISARCEHCDFSIDSDCFDKSVNHYIDQHGYKLLHVGTETILGPSGEPWHTTVAIVGK